MSDQHATHRDTQKLLVNLCLGLANGHDDAAPVGVFACNGRLNQRRLSNGETNFTGSSVRGGALNVDGDELARAFSIFHNLCCQVHINLQQRLPEVFQCALRHAFRLCVARLTRCYQYRCVTGGSITIDSNAIKRAVNSCAVYRSQYSSWNACIRKYKSQHRRHIGGDHTGAFCNTRNRDFGIADQAPAIGTFGKRIRCGNRPGSLIPGRATQLPDESGKHSIYPIHRQRLTNHPS